MALLSKKDLFRVIRVYSQWPFYSQIETLRLCDFVRGMAVPILMILFILSKNVRSPGLVCMDPPSPSLWGMSLMQAQ